MAKRAITAGISTYLIGDDRGLPRPLKAGDPAFEEPMPSTRVSLKKLRDYPLCGSRESRYNVRCDVQWRIAVK
jgi:hypothetical protein